MAKYLYKCDTCNIGIEHIQPMSKDLPAFLPCPSCSGEAQFVVQGAPAVATSGMSNMPIDVAIGKDAAARWADINKRQEIRNKVRAASGETGLYASGRNEFTPLTKEEKVVRNELNKVVKRDGFKGNVDSKIQELTKRTSD